MQADNRPATTDLVPAVGVDRAEQLSIVGELYMLPINQTQLGILKLLWEHGADLDPIGPKGACSISIDVMKDQLRARKEDVQHALRELVDGNARCPVLVVEHEKVGRRIPREICWRTAREEIRAAKIRGDSVA